MQYVSFVFNYFELSFIYPGRGNIILSLKIKFLNTPCTFPNRPGRSSLFLSADYQEWVFSHLPERMGWAGMDIRQGS